MVFHYFQQNIAKNTGFDLFLQSELKNKEDLRFFQNFQQNVAKSIA